MKTKYSITGMTCNGCANTVKKLLSKVQGVQDVQVSLAEETAEMTRDEQVTLDELKIALKGFPYGIVERV